MIVKFLLIRRQILVILFIAVSLLIHYFMLASKFQEMTIEQTANINGNISKIKPEKHCPALQNNEISRLILQETIRNGKPFDHLITEIENDQYLAEIASSGVSTIKNIQREFFLTLVPKLQDKRSIPIENKLISRWVKIEKNNSAVEKKIKMLSHKLSIQNLDEAIQIIDNLPANMQGVLHNWRKKIMDYIYVQEFLAVYLEE